MPHVPSLALAKGTVVHGIIAESTQLQKEVMTNVLFSARASFPDPIDPTVSFRYSISLISEAKVQQNAMRFNKKSAE